MPKRMEDVEFQFKRGIAQNWAEKNPVLKDGEPGFETDGKLRFKIGDGETPWNELQYAAGGLSAYEMAVSSGYMGTEQQWLRDLANEPSEALLDRITAEVIADLEPSINLVVLFENALVEGQ